MCPYRCRNYLSGVLLGTTFTVIQQGCLLQEVWHRSHIRLSAVFARVILLWTPQSRRIRRDYERVKAERRYGISRIACSLTGTHELMVRLSWLRRGSSSHEDSCGRDADQCVCILSWWRDCNHLMDVQNRIANSCATGHGPSGWFCWAPISATTDRDDMSQVEQ